MKPQSLAAVLAVSGALLAALATPNTIVHIKSHHGGLKFQEVEVIADNATCPNGGAVLMCESASYECQDDGTGAQKCLERDDAFLDDIDNTTTMPWAQCSSTNASLPSSCLFEFQCLCMDDASTECYCMPPDAWRTERKTAENCTTSEGEVGYCDAGEYCRTKDDYQECATAPYLPSSDALYSDCTDDDLCASGLVCEEFNDFFAMCVDEDDEQSDDAAAHLDFHVQQSAATENEPHAVLYTRVVEDGQSCEVIAGQLAMCASHDYVCRMEVGKEMYATAPSCLPYDPRHERDAKYTSEEAAVAPWTECDATQTRQPGDPPFCQRDFRCMCLLDGCWCFPPDAVVSSDKPSSNSMCACEADCPDGEYCKFLRGGGTVCGRKPYFSM